MGITQLHYFSETRLDVFVMVDAMERRDLLIISAVELKEPAAVFKESAQIRIGRVDQAMMEFVSQCDVSVKVQLPIIPIRITKNNESIVTLVDTRGCGPLIGIPAHLASRRQSRIDLLACSWIDRAAVNPLPFT